MKTKTLRLLIVDDEPSILELLGTALAALGDYDVTTAESGAEALRLIKADGPIFDCILLDIQMPELNGIDVCAEIRRRSLYRHVPIIMLTAMSDMDYVERAFRLGATDYVTKPFNFEDLRTRVAHANRLFQARLMPSEPEATDQPSQSVPKAPKPVKTVKYEAQFDMHDIERVIDTQRFENYVRQMARSKAKSTSAFAVRVTNAYFIHKAVSGPEFMRAMEAVARKLSEATDQTGSLISYRGRGVFLCLEYGARLSDTQDMAIALNSALSELTFGKNHPSVIVSRHVQLKQNNNASAMALLRDAIMTVERPSLEKLQETAPATTPNLRRSSDTSSLRLPEWRVSETQVYRDLFGSMIKGK